MTPQGAQRAIVFLKGELVEQQAILLSHDAPEVCAEVYARINDILVSLVDMQQFIRRNTQ